MLLYYGRLIKLLRWYSWPSFCFHLVVVISHRGSPQKIPQAQSSEVILKLEFHLLSLLDFSIKCPSIQEKMTNCCLFSVSNLNHFSKWLSTLLNYCLVFYCVNRVTWDISVYTVLCVCVYATKFWIQITLNRQSIERTRNSLEYRSAVSDPPWNG